MDVSAASGASSASLDQAASVAVLKKSMDAEQSVALQLIQAIQPAPQPPHLGQNVDLLA
ncbi:MAG: YjfB family protein [Chloroflexi bacterium]|nr:YjfB family protein [Chloroflexota bacterium]